MNATVLRPTRLAAAVHLAVASVLCGSAFAQSTEQTLQEVTIVGASEAAYNVVSSSTAMKTDTLLRDTPQAITVISKDLMRDQAIQTMTDVVRYVPGIVPSQGEGNRDAAIFRGNNSTSDFYIDGIRDDVQYFRDFYNIDSVEAIRGSNAMVFGRGGSGGVINRVSKQPQWTNIREGSVTLGSWENRRASADIGQAINDSMAFRVNAMAEDSGSFRDGVSVERKGVNPTLAIRAGKNTSVVLGYEHFQDERTADRGITSQDGRPFDTGASTFFGNAELSPTWSRVNAFTAVIDHDFGNGASLRNRTRAAGYDKFYQNVFASGPVLPAGTVAIGAYSNATERSNLFNQTDLGFAVGTGAVRHKLLVGAEFGRQETDNLRLTGFNPDGTTARAVPAANPLFAGPVLFRPSATDADNHGVARVASVYLQDQLEFSPQWQAVLGLRHDRFSVDFRNNRNGATLEQTDSQVAPRAGLIYKPVETVSLYGSYSIAYVPRAGEQLSSLSASNQAFDPEEFTNVELGAKWDIRPNLSASAAVYKLERTNVVIPGLTSLDPSQLVDGQTTRGVELGLSGKVTRAWSVMGGYAYQDAELTATQSATARDGARLAQVPKHSASLWNRYDFTPAWAAGLGLIYRDEIFTTTSNAVTLPSFTRVDAALFYTLSPNYRVQVNVENLFDKTYYASAHSDSNISPGSPRAVRVALNAQF